MKQTILILFSLLFVRCVYSQDTSTTHLYDLVDEYVKELQSQKIDTICIYRDYYVGYILKNEGGEPCTYENKFIPTYVFWQKNNKTFVAKKDNCFDFPAVPILANNFWDYYFNFKSAVLKEEVKRFQFKDKTRRKELLTKSISHSHFRRFEFVIGKEKCEKYFDDYDLLESSSGDTNINFQHNQNLKSKLIIDEIEKLINKLTVDNVFAKKERRL